MCPALHTVTTTSVCAVLKPVHWVSVLQIVGLQPMDEGGDSRVPAGALGMAKVKDLFVVSDRRLMTLGAAKEVVLDLLPSQGTAEQSSFFL